MSKSDMIAAIRQYNQSAEETFLASFDERSLENYLQRLTRVHNHRGRSSVWVRQYETPAIVMRRHRR